MANKRKLKLNPGLIFGWLGLLIAVGFFALRADETGDQLTDLFLRNQAHVESSVQSVTEQSQLLKAAMRDRIKADTTDRFLGLADTLKELEQQTSIMIAELNGHLYQLDSLAGRTAGSNTYQRAGEEGTNLIYWERNRSQLESLLEGYAYMIDNYNRMAIENNWDDLPLEGPIAANIALIQGIKLEVLQAERKVLDGFNQRLGVDAYQANRLIPWSLPTKESALVGMPFEIRLGFMATTDAVQPMFSSISGTIQADEEAASTAILTVIPRSQAIPFDQQVGTQSFEANIRVPKMDGGYEMLQIQDEFLVRKPIATMQPLKGYRLYRYCANDMRIEIPEVQDVNNLSIVATQANVLPSKNDPNLFRITPVANQSEIRISSFHDGKKTLISSLPVQIVSPPKPRIEILVNGEVYEGELPISKNSELSIRITPDAEFQAMYPEDANYGIGSVELRLQGKGPQEIVKVVEGTTDAVNEPLQIPLDELKISDQKAAIPTPIILLIDGIYQRNFSKKKIPDTEFSAQERTRILFVR